MMLLTIDAPQRTLRPSRRAGLAALEFMLVLPFLVILAALLFTLTRVCLARINSIQDARNEAWHNRYVHGGGSDLPLSGTALESVEMRGLINQGVYGGLQSGSGHKSTKKVLQLSGTSKMVFHGAISTESHHEVYSGPWDHEVIPFKYRPPLVPDSRVGIYLLDAVGNYEDLFASITGLPKPTSDEIEAWNKAKQAAKEIANRIKDLVEQIRSTQRELEDLREQLRLAKNESVKQMLQQDIDRLEKHLKKMRDSHDKLQKGLNSLPNL